MNEPNIPGFLKNLQLSGSDRQCLPFLGIDENLNTEQIDDLTRQLVSNRKVDMSAPLWYKTRVSQEDGSILFTIAGGVDRDSTLRQPNPFHSNIGKDKRGESWSDLRIAASLVVNFTVYNVLVLLSGDTHKNKDGLWNILNKQVKPNLPEGCTLVVLFKRSNTITKRFFRL